MSYVQKNIDGTYEVGILYQDGYERMTCESRSEAIAAYKGGIRSLGPYTADGEPPLAVPDPRIIDKSRWPVATAVSANEIRVDRGAIDDAVRLALSRGRLDAGSRYELRVEMVKATGDEPYMGEGI